MTVFVDSSAIVAMVAREPEATRFAETLEQAGSRLTSALAVWEATRGVESARDISFDEARSLVADFVTAAGLELVAIGPAEVDLALDAHALFGRGVHRASLNFGDCFAYACTRGNGASILFKGEDFARTDLPDATLA